MSPHSWALEAATGLRLIRKHEELGGQARERGALAAFNGAEREVGKIAGRLTLAIRYLQRAIADGSTSRASHTPGYMKSDDQNDDQGHKTKRIRQHGRTVFLNRSCEFADHFGPPIDKLLFCSHIQRSL